MNKTNKILSIAYFVIECLQKLGKRKRNEQQQHQKNTLTKSQVFTIYRKVVNSLLTLPMKFLRKSYFYLCLGLVTLFLVTTVIPTVTNSFVQASTLKLRQKHFFDEVYSYASTFPPTSTKSLFTLGQKIANGSSLLDQGRHLYQTGRYTEAATVWRQAVSRFEQQGDAAGKAGSLSYLSLAYQALGAWDEATVAITESLTILQQPESPPASILAQALNIQGQLQSNLGKTEAALESWQKSQAVYQSVEDEIGVMGSQINQAQALQTLGLHRRATQMLVSVNNALQAQDDSTLKVQGLRNLGVALQVVGEVNQAQEILEQSLTISQSLNPPITLGEIFLSLGNSARDLQQWETALDYYQKAVQNTNSNQVKVEALLNQLSLELQLENTEKAITLLPTIENNLAQIPPSRNSVYSTVNYAQSLTKLAKVSNSRYLNQAAPLTAQAVKQAQNLGDKRAQAYALKQLGNLYEQKQQWSTALKLTENSLQLAQSISANDISYGAAWQLGRLLEQEGKTSEAIDAYRSAFNTVQSLRSDLVAINTNIQFKFTENIEPIYRELVGLLLKSAHNHPETEQTNLIEARQIIEALQLAELDNFFQEACLTAQPQQIDQIDNNAAVIYPIILRDRLEVIVSIPGQKLVNYHTQIPQEELEQTFRLMRRYLNTAYTKVERLPLYQKGYNWLIKPVEKQLEQHQIKTLVFVLDGYLRSLPMAALHDGEQYLLEKYSIALSQGLQLLDPQSIQSNQLEAVTAGLSEARDGFRALPAVESEISTIADTIGTKVLLNQEFTPDTLQNALDSQSSPVLHLATHGQFSSIAEDTFILTWNGRIKVKDLDKLLRIRQDEQVPPIELLVLSACQTAKGDNRAMLGLSGVAIRSGARSTLGTLWSVRDQSTAQLMAKFYQELKQPGVSKSEALRRAQLYLLKGEYEHPLFWAPFVLVGNWL